MQLQLPFFAGSTATGDLARRLRVVESQSTMTRSVKTESFSPQA
jgi:hypothetical protein